MASSVAAKRVAQASSAVEVFVRMRPLLAREASNQDGVIAYSANSRDGVVDLASGPKPKKYKGFQDCIAESNGNADVFASACMASCDDSDSGDVMQSVACGRTACVFAYGHTGSGKTHTIFGYRGELGLYALAASELCDAARLANEDSSGGGGGVFVGVRFYQLYQGKFQDLLSSTEGGKPLTQMAVREDADGRMNVRAPAYKCPKSGLWRQPGLTLIKCESVADVQAAVNSGLKSRSVGSSGVHDQSSRSHVFLEMELMSYDLASAESVLLDVEAAVFPLGHEAAGEQFRQDDHLTRIFKEEYGAATDVIAGHDADRAGHDAARERGAVKNTAKDTAFAKFKASKKALSAEENARFDPEGWVFDDATQSHVSKLSLLERSVDEAERNVLLQKQVEET